MPKINKSTNETPVITANNDDDSIQKCAKIKQFLDDQKAVDIVECNVIGQSPFTDFMVIASGTSARHVVGMARNLERFCYENGIKIHSVSGKTAGDWVLVDCFGVTVHLFRPPVRQYYDLERLWATE